MVAGCSGSHGCARSSRVVGGRSCDRLDASWNPEVQMTGGGRVEPALGFLEAGRGSGRQGLHPGGRNPGNSLGWSQSQGPHFPKWTCLSFTNTHSHTLMGAHTHGHGAILKSGCFHPGPGSPGGRGRGSSVEPRPRPGSGAGAAWE